MTDKNIGRALLVWAALLALLVLGWKLAFDPRFVVRVTGNLVWAVTAVCFGRWFIWIGQMNNGVLCDNCEGKKHRK